MDKANQITQYGGSIGESCKIDYLIVHLRWMGWILPITSIILIILSIIPNDPCPLGMGQRNCNYTVRWERLGEWGEKPSDSISFLTNTKMGIVIKKLFMKLLLSILNSKQLKKCKAINC